MLIHKPCGSKTALCVDCKKPGCDYVGNRDADCPYWVCQKPGTKCRDCELLKMFMQEWRDVDT